MSDTFINGGSGDSTDAALRLALSAGMASVSGENAQDVINRVQPFNSLQPSIEGGAQMGGNRRLGINATSVEPGGNRNVTAPATVRITHNLHVGYTTEPIQDSPVVTYHIDTAASEFDIFRQPDDNSLRLCVLDSATYHRNAAWKEFESTGNGGRTYTIITPDDYRRYMLCHDQKVTGQIGQHRVIEPVPSVDDYGNEVANPARFNRNYRMAGVLIATKASVLGYKTQAPLSSTPDSFADRRLANPHNVKLSNTTFTVQLVSYASVWGNWAPEASSSNPVYIQAGDPAYHYVPALEPGVVLKTFVGYHRRSICVRHSCFDYHDPRVQEQALIDVSIGPASNPYRFVPGSGESRQQFNVAFRWMRDAYVPRGIVNNYASDNLPSHFLDHFPVPQDTFAFRHVQLGQGDEEDDEGDYSGSDDGQGDDDDGVPHVYVHQQGHVPQAVGNFAMQNFQLAPANDQAHAQQPAEMQGGHDQDDDAGWRNLELERRLEALRAQELPPNQNGGEEAYE